MAVAALAVIALAYPVRILAVALALNPHLF
jgi:hypothetical protein